MANATKTSKIDIWMPLYIGDYLSDTMHLTRDEHGAYLLLLFHYWSNGSLPNNDKKLAAISKCSLSEWSDIKETLSEFFTMENKLWVNSRLETERIKAIKNKEHAVARAKKGADARWNATSNASSIPKALLEGCTLPSPKPLTPKTPSTDKDLPAGKPAGTKKVPVTKEIWEAYKQAYLIRYKTEPIRNASVNSKLAQVVKRLGAESSPYVAYFYVTVNNSYYLQKGHDVGSLLADCEKLHTEWKTGRTVTATGARQADQKQSNYNAFAPLIAEAEAREAKRDETI